MTLVDYDFYISEYGGSVVGADSFGKIERRAESFLSRLTFNQIIAVNDTPGQMIRREFEAFTENELQTLKYGLCSLIESMDKLEKAELQALSGNSDSGNVKSRSSGGESISYESHKTAYDDAMQDETKKNALLRNALMEYVQPCAFRHNPFYAGSW